MSQTVNPFEIPSSEHVQQMITDNTTNNPQIQNQQFAPEEMISQRRVQEYTVPDPISMAPIQQPIQQPVQPIQQPVQQVQQVQQPVQQPIQQPIQQPVQQIQQIQQPVQQPIQQAPQQLNVVSAPPPQLEPGQQLICQMTPGTFDSFIKVVSLLDSKSVINISHSRILQLINNNTTILQTNISHLCNNQDINLHILNPKENIKLFKAIKDNNDVYFIDDVPNKRFQVISGDIRLWLPKQIDEIAAEVRAPQFELNEILGSPIVISKEERSKISNLMSGSTSITLLIDNDQLKGYLIPEKVESSFKQYTGVKISEKNASLKLISSSFLNIPSDGDTSINIMKQNDNYWMVTKIITAMVEVVLIESLTISQDEILLL